MKLSIITINYNDASGLQKTLESIALQSFTDYEQIIIDGGSTDESVEVIKKYEAHLNPPEGGKKEKQRFCWISEKDTGIYNAQNKGILKASGKYCLFLNAGDYLVDKNVLDTVFKNELKADVIYGNLIVLINEKVIGISKGKRNTTFLDVYSSIIKHQASFIKRDLFNKYGLYDESLKIVADWAFFFKTVGINSVSLKYIDVDITCFDNNGFSNNNPELCKQERQNVLDQYMPALLQEEYLLFEKYRGIRYLDKWLLGRFLFRIIAKVFK